MELWNRRLIFIGIAVIAIASFAFAPEIHLSPSAQMSDREAFQIFLGIAGFALVIWGIVRD